MLRKGLLLTPLLAAACTSQPYAEPAPDLAGTAWLAEDIEGRGVIDIAQSTLKFPEPGRVAGSGGCNGYFGAVKLGAGTVEFSALGSTRMACPEALMDQEQRFLVALEKSRRYRFDYSTGLLYLLDPAGAELLRFSRLNE